MFKIVFNDGLTLKTFENGVVKSYESDFHSNYAEAAKKAARDSEWKTKGAGARFMGVSDVYDTNEENGDISYFNSVDFLNSPDKIVYSITVDQLSGIITKDLTSKKYDEGHIIHSRELVFNGAHPEKNGKRLVTCIKDNFVNSHLAVYDMDSSDYMTVTDGDSADFDATFSSRNDSLVYFASKGAGRNSRGEFVRYSPSSIYTYDLFGGDVEEILSDEKKSLVKPKDDTDGNLYYIIRPEIENKRSVFGTLLDVLLIPWKLFKAIFYFFELFTTMFTGKGFSEKSNNPAKTMDKSPREIVIEDNLINANEEYKRNLRHKDNFAGIAPWSWQLVKRDRNGNVTPVKNGVIDYRILSGGRIVYTNGKHIVLINADGKCEKLADATLCTKLSVIEF